MKKVIIALTAVNIVILTGCSSLSREQAPTTPPSPPPPSPKISKHLYNGHSKLLLHVRIKDLLALKNREELEKYITVTDQDGNIVTHLPVKNGQISVSMKFIPKILDLKYNEKEIPISLLIYQVCSILQHDIKYSSVKTSFPESKDIEELVIEEISWNSTHESLLFSFNN